MTRIIIGICTRERNALLRRLIDSIWLQPTPDSYDVAVVIVDNNDTPTADDAVSDLPPHFTIDVVHEPRVGLVYARNRTLDEATARGAKWFIGVDDDAWVANDWLAMMIKGFETMEREVIVGRCEFVYDDTRSPYVRKLRLPYRHKGQRPGTAATGNYALHRNVFDPAYGPGLRFDPYFNEFGGEDLEFFARAERLHGFVPGAMPDARSYEAWFGVRATLRYRLLWDIRTQIVVHQVARRHRILGIRGSRISNAAYILRRLNYYFVNGIVHVLAGLRLLFQDKRAAQLRFGAAMALGARTVAIFMYVSGLKVRYYAPGNPRD